MNTNQPSGEFDRRDFLTGALGASAALVLGEGIRDAAGAAEAWFPLRNPALVTIPLAFVTAIVLPMAIKTPDALQKVLTFQRVEHRFAPLARWYNIITGISGFAMVWLLGLQGLYFTKAGLALTFMTGVWVFWFVMLGWLSRRWPYTTAGMRPSRRT